MEAKKEKGKGAAVADIPQEVTLADVLEELQRIRKEVAERTESIRRLLFYLPAVAEGAKASKAKRDAEKATESGAK